MADPSRLVATSWRSQLPVMDCWRGGGGDGITAAVIGGCRQGLSRAAVRAAEPRQRGVARRTSASAGAPCQSPSDTPPCLLNLAWQACLQAACTCCRARLGDAPSAACTCDGSGGGASRRQAMPWLNALAASAHQAVNAQGMHGVAQCCWNWAGYPRGLPCMRSGLGCKGGGGSGGEPSPPTCRPLQRLPSSPSGLPASQSSF